jgi:hypothetical protein
VSEESSHPAKIGAGERGHLAALVRTDHDSATRFLAELPVAQQARAICELPAERRADALALAPDPGAVVRLMPEIDLCATAVAAGPERSGWFLSYASGDQIVACLDLDGWRGQEIDEERLDTWLRGLADAGDATLLRGVRAVDSELLALWARRHLEFFFRPGDDDDWEPPDDTRTLDGEYHYRARRSDGDLELPLRVLHLLLQDDQLLYVSLVHDIAARGEVGDEEEALRWRHGRLVDLGFPPREEALSAYSWLDPETGLRLPPETEGWEEPAGSLPTPQDRPLLPYPLFEAIALLSPDERELALVAFMQLANKVLIAEGLSLGDADAVRQAMGRTAELAGSGLEALAEKNGRDEASVLRRVPLEHLFRVGANLTGANASLLGPAPSPDEDPS